MGGSATTENRKKIESFMKRLLNGEIKVPDFDKRKIQGADRFNLFDSNYVAKSGGGYDWAPWLNPNDPPDKIPPKSQPQ